MSKDKKKFLLSFSVFKLKWNMKLFFPEGMLTKVHSLLGYNDDDNNDDKAISNVMTF